MCDPGRKTIDLTVRQNAVIDAAFLEQCQSSSIVTEKQRQRNLDRREMHFRGMYWRMMMSNTAVVNSSSAMSVVKEVCELFVSIVREPSG